MGLESPMHRRRENSASTACHLLTGALVLLTFCVPAQADDLDDARKLLLAGHYQRCIEACQEPSPDNFRREEWNLLHAQALLAIGEYPRAEIILSNALERSASSVRLRWLGVETANFTGQPNVARARLREINQLVAERPWAYRDPADLVALGRMALMMGADPKTVLERLYTVAQRADASQRDVWLAPGELALQKHDFALAAKTYTDALKKIPGDPDLLYGLARAYLPSARPKALELAESALEKNENHIPSRLLLVDHLVDAEEYGEAGRLLDRVFKINPWHPEAWAYRAVIAHLQHDPAGESNAREKALKYWKTNPSVDHLIGRKLSQNYRFAEGAVYQRRALGFDSDFVPARIQLAEDLLRLGEDAEGWQLAEQVHKQNAYDVTAYNLVTLRATMEKFQTLTNEHFILRMSAPEAALYGDRAMALLLRAQSNLTARYGIELAKPTVIEIFPEQKDFGVRTFGMPHNPGFLGVCFGRVVTANSPASQGGSPANWEAVLWHEFCHVVTLQLTKNKMPRWLSEGISVYEELQANPVWGQTMNPQYREMVLGGDLTPVGELSSAFMSPKSDLHVQFAYYQSALVVEYLVGKFGFEKLKAILQDLGAGAKVNDAIARHTAPIRQIEKEFEAFAKARAEALAPGLSWEKPQDDTAFLRQIGFGPPRSDRRPEVQVESPPPQAGRADQATNQVPVDPNAPPHPAPSATASKSSDKPNYWSLLEQATKHLSDKRWADARTPLRKLVEFYPNQNGPNNAYAMLATVYRELKELPEERDALEKWAASEADALDACLRLMELAEQAGDWKAVTLNAERALAVNPLLPQPYRHLARASETLSEARPAIGAYEKLLLLDPADPADVHFRLGRLLHQQGDAAARRHVLQALEEAPRFREAHRLLLELAQTNPAATNIPPTP